jgi:Flp pilus assembly protein TadD
VLTFAAHLPSLGAGYVWDDDAYITENPKLEDLSGLRDIWFQVGATKMYVPLVFSTFWVEHQFWGTRPLGYHVTNLALHAAGAILLWLLLLRLQLPGAWLAAAMMAVHPVFVESVAWATELKNTQSTVFALLCLLAYFRFSPPESEVAPAGREWRFYALALLAFVAALLSKPVVVALPLVLLLLLWWRRGRMPRADIAAVTPMLLLSLGAGLMAMHVERLYGGARGDVWQMPFLDRALVAGRALWFYAGKLVWPADLVPIYPRWKIDPGALASYLYPLAAAAVLVGLWSGRRRLGRGPFVAAASFVLLLAPLIGFFNVSYFLNSYVADHFQHHAAPALLALFAAGAAALPRRFPRLRPAAPWAAALLLAGLAVASHLYSPAFHDEEARCRATLAKNPGSWLAMNNLGVSLNRQGRFAEAVGWFEKAIAVRRTYPEAESNLGVALMGLGRPSEAIAHYREALRIWPENPLAHNNLGTALAQAGEVEDARREYETALRLRPGYPEARANLDRLAAVAAAPEDPVAAERVYREAVRRNPASAEARNDLGTALASRGEIEAAIAQFAEAVRLQPGSAETQLNLGTALLSSGRSAEALAPLEAAVGLQPDHGRAQLLLGVVLAQLGRLPEARLRFEEALRIDPADREARENLERARAALANR